MWKQVEVHFWSLAKVILWFEIANWNSNLESYLLNNNNCIHKSQSMPMIGVPEYLSRLLGSISLNVIVVQGKTMNSGTYSIWSTTNFAYDCQKLQSFSIDKIFIKNLERSSSLKITEKNTRQNCFLTISKGSKRIPQMNSNKTWL